MKSVLITLSSTLTILLTMVSCQSQGTRSLRSHDDIRHDIIFKSDADLELDVERIIKTASQTQNVQFFGYKMN